MSAGGDDALNGRIDGGGIATQTAAFWVAIMVSLRRWLRWIHVEAMTMSAHIHPKCSEKQGQNDRENAVELWKPTYYPGRKGERIQTAGL